MSFVCFLGGRTVNGIKSGDIVRLKEGFKTDAYTFQKGEEMVVIYVGLFGLDLEDKTDKKRWVTDVSYKDVEKIS